MRRIACIILASLLPTFARAAVRLTPEVAIADPSPAAPQEGVNRPDAVATDGSDLLVVWSGLGGLNIGVVAADGGLKGLPRLAIARAEQIRDVSLCWTGAAYLVTWGEGSSSDDLEVVAATLARDGTLASGPRIVAKPAFTQTGALASNGRRALLAYTRLGTSSLVSVQGALFDAEGALVAADVPLPISITVSNYADPVPQIASDGNEFALLWRTGEVTPALFHTFHLARVSEDGTALAEPITFPRTNQTGQYGIAFGGGKYAVAAIEEHLRLLRFVVDPGSGAVTRLPSVDSGGWDASVLWNGSRFVAYWMDYSTTFFKLLTVAYESSMPAVVVSGTHAGHQPRLATNGRNVFAAWSETAGAGEQIRAARLDTTAAVLADPRPSLVSTSWSRQLAPAVATSGHDSLMVWVDENGEGNYGRLLAARVSLSGAVIDRKPIEIGPAAPSIPAGVVFTGVTYLVVWQEPVPVPIIVARTVGRDGALGPRISLGAGSGATAAAASSVTLVTFNVFQAAVGVRFTPAGELLDSTPIRIHDGYGTTVATNGTDFFVAWNVGSDYWQFPYPDKLDILGVRVTASGAVDASPLPIATGPRDQILRAIAGDGRDYLVVYGLTDYGFNALAAKRVLREGQLDGVTARDDGAIISSSEAPSSAAVTADADGFWVAWTGSSLELTRTDRRGNPGEILSIAPQPSGVALTQRAQGPLQLAYARRVSDGPFPMAVRAFVRFFGDIVEPRGRATRH